MHRIRIALIIAFLLSFSAVLGGEETEYYYTRHISPMVSTDCFGCHCSIFQFMCSYDVFVAFTCEIEPTVGLPAVYPGRPDSSVVMWRLNGETPSGETLEIMPYKQGKLSDSKIAVWNDWIAQGAVKSAPVGVENKKKTWGEIKKSYRK